MALNPEYILGPSLQEFFIDKDSGLPLSGGKIFFFSDNARSILKDVFEISGAPPNYSYTVLPNPLILSAVGTIVDTNGADILPYYFPFDNEGNVDNYYIVVYNSMGVLQFTREGFPNFTTAEVSTSVDITNFIPNGQFLAHDNIPATSANSFTAGKVSADNTVIAPGGWTFNRGPSSTATDFVTFPAFATGVLLPTGNPRFAVQVNTTVAGSDTFKDIRINFPGVNTFASDIQSYDFYFEGESVNASDILNCQVVLRKFFGTGGSPSATTETPIGTFTLLGQEITSFNFSFIFGLNTGDVLGTNGDDMVSICVRLPPTGVQDALFDDFALVLGIDPLTAYPTQTAAQQIIGGVAGGLPVPDPNGFDIGLPIIYTPTGFSYSQQQIGQIAGALYNKTVGASLSQLLCDGSVYVSSQYGPTGIPYARLGNFLIANSPVTNTPMFGTGSNYVLTTQSTNTFTVVTQGGSGSASAGTSGFTLVSSAPSFQFTIGTAPAASTYFTFTTIVPTTYAVWYQLNGSAAPTGTGATVLIPVVITAGMTTTQIAVATQLAINSYQYAVPNFIGGFFRGLDTTGAVDPDYATRTIAALGLTGAYVGSLEAQAFLSHNHPGSTVPTSASAGVAGVLEGTTPTGTQPITVAAQGGSETRPVNYALNWFIYY